MALSRRRSAAALNIWPGFVDALTQLTMVIVFVLLIFTVGQFYLSGTVSSQDAAIHRLTQQINQLNAMLSVETTGNGELKTTIGGLTEQLNQVKSERDALAAQVTDATETHQQLTDRDAQVALLNQNIEALKKQLDEISAALDLSKKEVADQHSQIDDLGQKLNTALASKAAELARYRSEFFGKLREVLGDRPDIRIVGDRFVFQSEVLFAPGSAELGDAARQKLTPVVKALKAIADQIPSGIDWILEVDGHTDRRPINTPEFPSNWELSTARAVSVVKFLLDQGIPAAHVAAAGFGEFQPLDAADGEDSFRKNRRIELKLTQP